MEWELVSSGSFIPPCHVSFSSCLDVSRIRCLWTDTIVGWDNKAPFWLCVGVREASIGVINPVGVTIPANWLFQAIPAGILFPTDPAGILFPADLVEPVTIGVADLADAGILFPAVPAGIPFTTDPAGILFPADLAELVTVGVADLSAAVAAPLTVPDVFTELELFTMEMVDVMWMGFRIYYGDDYDGLWDPECDDIGYMGNFRIV